MEKEKDIYHGIALAYCISIISQLLVSLSTYFVSLAVLPQYPIFISITSLVIYVLTLYVVFWRIKSYPDIKLWFFAILMIVQCLPILLAIYSPEEEHFLSFASEYSDTISVVYSFCFAYFAYKLNKQGRNIRGMDDELNPQYIYYGMALIPLISAVLDIVNTCILSLCKSVSLPVHSICLLAVLLFTLYIYLFFLIIRKKPLIRGLYLFVIPLAVLLEGRLLSPASTYSYTLVEYMDIYTALSYLGSYTILAIFIISFIRYYQIEKSNSREVASRKRNWFYVIIVTTLIIVGLFLLSQVLHKEYMNSLDEQYSTERVEEQA